MQLKKTKHTSQQKKVCKKKMRSAAQSLRLLHTTAGPARWHQQHFNITRPKWRLGSGLDLHTRARRKGGGGNQKSTRIYYNIKLLPPLLPLDKSHIHQGRQKLCHLNISHNIYFNYFFLGVSAVTVQSFQRQLI